MFKLKFLKVLSVFLILEIIFSNGFLIFAQTVPTSEMESKIFYFRSQAAQLADSHILSSTPPVSGNSSLTSITSTDSPAFRHFHPGKTNFQHVFPAEPAHTPPVDSASWISDTPLNGTFQPGNWRFIVHKNDNIKGEVSVPHFNVYSSPSNTNLDQAVFLFEVEGPDWWTSFDEQINFSTPSLGQFEFNNAYLIVQLFDRCKSGCNGGKTMTVFEDGTTSATQTRIETPLFTQAGSVPLPASPTPSQPEVPAPPTPAPPPVPEPPAPPAQPPALPAPAPKNSPPVVVPIPAQSVIVGTPVTFQVLATDADLDKLTFSLGPNAPLGAKIDPVSGVFSWLPQTIGTTSLEILVSDGVNAPVTTGRLVENRNLGADGILGTADDIFIGGMATWAMVKAQARDFLGILLDDMDALNLPLLAADAYGNFIKGPNGFPQLVVAGANPGDPQILVEGNPALPVDASKAVRTNHPFLVDISHEANPVNSRGVKLQPDSDNVTGLSEPGTYDNELLDAHFVAGDGRVNENIGLTSVHHVFHSEHNRMVEFAKDVILETNDLVFLNQWLAAGSNLQTFPKIPQEIAALSWNGERLFQVAKFGTEMQYQHLVFEEFARKIQPQVNIFSGYSTDIDPAIAAEFAHTVYRFGHTMLTDTIARTNADGTTNDIGLIQAFLNPLEFVKSGQTPESAAGAIAAGMIKQTGSGIDEFVTEALRSNLLGLPLDLATINLARGRDTGVPPLNAVRKQFFVATGGDSSLKPYTSWTDFALSIKHPESLINFIAAYGTHPSTASVTTLAEKRAAATLLVNGGGSAPLDRLDFLNSTGDWVNGPDGITITGVDAVDFWIGGLAEKQMPFGGLLGPSFNFVFETQMEKLQDGDRLYYLTRNAGLNFLTQLEQNSFAELLMRNTTGVKHPPHDIFSSPSFTIEASEIDPLNLPLDTIIMPDGTIRYTGVEHIVMGGTSGRDLLHSSEGDDTLWGDGGNDLLEGGAGNDFIIGGDGDDILTDIFGDDNIKGGGGNDVINGGPGIDLILGGDGHDFVVAGRDSKETFGGAGNDFIIAGDGADTVFGNEGDDWIEGGNQADLLQGDNGNPFQDSTTIGNDVIAGGGGNDDYDAESGDDIMLADPGIERNEGMLGFDWVIYKNDPQRADADMFITGLLPPTVNDLRDRFDLVEGLSGGQLNDILRGDNRTGVELSAMHANSGQNNALNNSSQIALINGLQSLLGDGAASFAGGNIILGGAGSDILEGRGGDDIIDGDAWLNVRLSVRDATNPGVEILSADSMADLQTAMFEGKINPGQIKIIREILTTEPTAGNIDTAVFSGNLADYTISSPDALGRITVKDNRQASGGGGSPREAGRDNDGTDILRNIERLQFADQTVDLGNSNTVESPALSVNPFIASGGLPIKGGLTLIKSDLEFILDQIKISEANAEGIPFSSLIPKDTLPWGLRTVDGSLNNIVQGQSGFGSADLVFPRLTTSVFQTAENVTIDLDGPGPLALGQPTSYSQTNGFVFDSKPRLISNLIVDQTVANPAALAAAGPFAIPDPDTKTLFIPNIAPDMGLSAPFNSWFTLFGQFFDHGLDLVNKGGSGTVFIPLISDDPLFNPLSRSNFMVLTRATNQQGPDGILGTADDIHEHINQTSPFVDQNQTYTSHPSHQVFLRAFNFRPANISPVSLNLTVTPLLFSVSGQGRFASATGQTITPKVVSLGTSVVSVEAGKGIHSVTVPDGTEITKSDGSHIDITALTAAVPSADSLTGMNSGVVVNGKLQWGIPNQGLLFSNPITLDIFVGTDLNGQTLDVLRSETGTGNWTNDGIVTPGTCIVSSGICSFQATKASVYIAAKTVSSRPEDVVPTPVITTTPTPAAVLASNNSSSSGSNSSLAPVSAPVCTDSKPGSNPALLSVVTSGHSHVTLTWSKAADPVSHYAIVYGLTPGNPIYGNPNVGGKDTTSYVVDGLSGGTTYYFKVKAINGCNGSEYSNELSASSSGGVAIQPASGFSERVLGAKNELAPAAPASGNSRNRVPQLALTAIVLSVIAFGLYYRFARRAS